MLPIFADTHSPSGSAFSQPFRITRAVWMSATSAIILTGIMILGAISRSTNELNPHFNTLFICLSNLAIFIILYFFNFGLLRIKLKNAVKVPLCLFGSLLIAVFYTFASFQLEMTLDEQGDTSNPFYLTMIANLAASLISFLVSLLIYNLTQHQQTILENEHLKSENLTIRYQTLQQQISPHYLFNSLNTLDALIGNDDPNAHNYLHQLATTFRYTMQKQTVVSLTDELEFTHAYIYLMQIRYGHNLCIDEHIDPQTLSARVAPISLQLLVENAIKHNVISQRYPLCITIETTAAPSIRVSNPLHPKADSEDSTGLGLANLAQRYRLLFKKDITINDDGNTFSVEIPL